jgi:hypothetical protein
VSDSFAHFLIEIYIDLTVVAGVVFFLVGRRFRWWLLPFAGAVAAQVYTLAAVDPFPDLSSALIFTALLGPAIAANLVLAQRLAVHVREAAAEHGAPSPLGGSRPFDEA